jgi:hypothetical protein
MSYYSINLLAGVPYRQDTPGSLILIDSIGASAGVDVALIRNGTPGTTMPARKTAFRYVADYDGVLLTSAVNATVGIFLSFNDVQLGFADGASVSVPAGVLVTNPVGNPVNVLFGGTVAPVLGNVTVTNDPAHAVPVTLHGSDDATPIPIQKATMTTLVDIAPVTAGIAAVVLVADATLKRLTVRNASTAATIAIGGAGVTMANGARQLGPGDMWIEEDAPGATWYVISDTAATAVQISGAK